MRKFQILALLLGFVLCLTAIPLVAGGIDFTGSGLSGGVEFNGGTGPATANGIAITTVSFNSMSDAVTGKNCGPAGHKFMCGILSFTTGDFITSGVNGSGQRFDEFAGGGTINLIGKVPGGSVTSLVSATFNGPVTFTQTAPGMLTMTSNINVTSISPSVLALFPGVAITGNGTLTVTFQGTIFKNHGMNGHGTGANLFIQTTPELPGIILLGSGFLGLIGLRRRLPT